MRSIVVALLVVVSFASSAEACNRCGLFGRKCRNQAVYYSPIYKQQAAYYPQHILNIANVYPQGSSVYSAGSAAQLYAVNPELAITSATRVADGAIQSLQAAIKLGESNIGQVAEVAKIQAATEHLRLAMSAGQQQSSNLTLRITQGAGGIQVQQVQDPGSDQPPPRDDQPSTSMLSQKCAKCHGVDLAQPKGGLYFDVGATVNSEQFADSMVVLSGVNVPEPMKALVESLTDQEKGQLIQELRDLYLNGKREEDLPPPPPPQ